MMPLERQVSPLAESRRLKELGVWQNSHFFWFEGYNGTFFVGTEREHFGGFPILYSAFTVAELGEMLPGPNTPPVLGMGLNWAQRVDSGPNAGKWYTPGLDVGLWSKSEAEARSRLLIALIEAGAVKP